MKGFQKEGRFGMEVFFTITLFLVFALCAVSIMVVGARAYSNIQGRMEENSASRTALYYISNIVKEYDQTGGVEIQTRWDEPVLCLKEEINGQEYERLLYYYDGSVRELYTAVGNEMTPDNGLPVLETGGLRFEQQSPDMLYIEAESEGGVKSSLLLSLRSGGNENE